MCKIYLGKLKMTENRPRKQEFDVNFIIQHFFFGRMLFKKKIYILEDVEDIELINCNQNYISMYDQQL